MTRMTPSPKTWRATGRALLRAVVPGICLITVGAGSLVGVASSPDSVLIGGGRVFMNGVLMEVRVLRLAAEPAALAAALEPDWAALRALSQPPATQAAAASSASRILLGRQRGSLHETVTLSAAGARGQTLAILSVLDLSRPVSEAPAPPFALPPGTRVVSRTEWIAGEGGRGRGERTFVVHRTASPTADLQRLERAARSAGWTFTDSPAAARSPLRIARRGSAELTLVATPREGGSAITMVVGVAR
jgi:hypothetical protein